jgi:hypothetical protein
VNGHLAVPGAEVEDIGDGHGADDETSGRNHVGCHALGGEGVDKVRGRLHGNRGPRPTDVEHGVDPRWPPSAPAIAALQGAVAGADMTFEAPADVGVGGAGDRNR